MKRTAQLALVGISISLLGLASMFVPMAYYAFPLHRDRFQTFYFKGSQVRSLPECTVMLEDVDRAVTLNRSFNMLVDVRLDPSAFACRSRVQLSAAAFDVKPESVECNLSKGTAQQTERVYFNVLPKEAGTQQVVFTHSGDGGGASRTMEFTVYEYPHVPPDVSFWFPRIDMLFGGMLTVPWWIELFRKRSKGKQ
jgi:hypothetical protein